MTYYRPKRVNTTELLEMQVLLEQCGYNPAYAELLQREGMGPYELKDRLRIEPGSVGSLEYTHGMKYWTEQPRRRAMENPVKRVIVPAKPGDIVLITPGALGDPNGRVHWWQFEMTFGRPDGSTGTSQWLIAAHKYAARRNFDPNTFEVIGDLVWRPEFTSNSGGIDSDAIQSFMERGAMNPVVTIVDDKSLKPIKRIRSSTARLQQTRTDANVWAMHRAERTGRGALVITPKQRNPMDLRNPLSLRGKEAVLGVGLIVGVIGIAMLMRSTTASAATLPAAGPVAVTNKDAGPISLRVGDTLNVTLTLSGDMTEYLSTSTGSVLTQGTSVTQAGTTTETWTAAAAGAQTISYQGINASNVAVGTPIAFNVTVS